MSKKNLPYGKRVIILEEIDEKEIVIFKVIYNKKQKKSLYYVETSSIFLDKVKTEYKSKIVSLYKFFERVDIEIYGKIDSFGEVYFYDIYLNKNFIDYDLLVEAFSRYALKMPDCLYNGEYTKYVRNNFINKSLRSFPEESPRIFFTN